jgi:hypothetical protein
MQLKSSAFSFHLLLILPCPESQSLTRATPRVNQWHQILIPLSHIARHSLLRHRLCTTTAATAVHCHSSCTSKSGAQWSSSQWQGPHSDSLSLPPVNCHQSQCHPLSTVRGHPFVSLLPLSSPTLLLFICIHPPHLCTIPKDYNHSRWLLGLMVRRLPSSRLTNSRRLPASPPAHTSTASDRLRTHWDRSAWCYGTLRHHVDNPIWEAWY